MQVKDVIKILSELNPEDEINFTFTTMSQEDWKKANSISAKVETIGETVSESINVNFQNVSDQFGKIFAEVGTIIEKSFGTKNEKP